MRSVAELIEKENPRTAAMMEVFAEAAATVNANSLEELKALVSLLDSETWLSPDNRWFDNRDGAIGSSGFAALCLAIGGVLLDGTEALREQIVFSDGNEELRRRLRKRLLSASWTTHEDSHEIRK